MMANNTLSSSIKDIRLSLKAYPAETLTGAHLNDLIRRSAPYLNIRECVDILVGPGALTKFVELHLSDVLQRDGNQGGDVLYRIAPELGDKTSMVSRFIWKTFISPNTNSRIILGNTPPLLKLITDPSISIDPDTEIEKATFAEHDEIRAEFALDIGEDLSQEVKNLNANFPEYPVWIEELKNISPALVRKWHNFRGKQLQRLFEDRVSSLPIDDQRKEAVILELHASRRAMAVEYSNGPKIEPREIEKPQRSRTTEKTETHDIDKARSIAHSAIDAMGYDELRGIHLPLGALLDSL